MDDVKNPKDVRAFWERKANSVESPHSPLGRHGFSTVVRHGEDPAGEAKRRTNEELNEVLKQRRHSSASPEPHVVTYRKPVTRSTNRDSTRSADGRSHRDSWKKTAVAAAAVVAERTTYTNTRSISPQPFYIHNDSTKAKMAERTSIFKRASSTKPHPLKPTNSSKYKSLPPPPPSSKRRPFSTSAIEGSIAVASSQSTDSRHQSLQPIYQDDIDGPCNEQHLMERDSVPDNVKLFRTLLDGITKERRSCYLKSPVISQHLTATSRGRMDSILCKEDYLVTMVTVVVEISEHKEPITLSMRVGVTVSHVIEAILDVLPKLHPLRSHDLLLKVCGRDEYLDNDMLLSDYEYTHQCLKFGLDVHIAMVTLASANQTFSSRPSSPKQEDYFLCFNNSAIPFSREPLNRLLCLFFNKVEQYRSTIQSSCSKMLISMAEGLIHSTQLICQLLSTIEPLTVCEAIHYIKQTTVLLLNVLRDDKQQDVVSPFTPSDSEPYTTFEGWNLIELPNSPVGSLEALQQKALSTTDTLKDAVMEFVADYCTSFNLPFMPVWTGSRDIAQDHISTVNISSLNEPIRIKVCCVHRVGTLSYHMYQVEACLYYGGCQIGKTRFSHRSRGKKSFFNSITWDEWFNFSLMSSELPLETRICFTIYGCESLQRKPIGWVAMPLFNINKHLQTGEHYLCVWPTTEGANPIGTCDGNHSDDDSMILQVAFDRRSNAVVYDDVVNTKSVSHGYPSLPTEHALRAAAQKDHFNTLTEEEQQLLWNNRKALPRVLHSCPRGLPLLLLSVPKHDHTHLKEVHAIVDQWKLPHPIDSLELLNVQFADVYVRAKALSWLQELSSDDLFDLLPQLVQVIKYDWYGFFGTTKFLLQQAVKSPRIAHMLFWLTHPLLNDPSFGLQYMMLWVGLKIVCNGPIGEALDQQLTMVQSLNDIATAVKTAKDSSRHATLLQHLKRHSTQLSCTQHRLPLSLSMLVSGMDIDNCSFFNSNTVPLKLTFVNQNPRGDKIPIIFKVGDDLRQDMLTLQLIKLMEKLWLRAGLDLKLITYLCLSTGPNQGMLEMVTEAETLRSIQTSHGLTGAFNDKRLSQWLMKHNTTDVSYKKATECFIRSCAGYCVATYVLGICDRHNDNIMVKESGHMFHIDFGRIFGNAQMFGNIKRDRAPFVLTPDMAYVINGGDTPTTSFQKFTDLCCTAYNELRRNCNLFINLLELMLTSGMPELSSSEDVQYVRDALLPGVTDTEATIAFTRCIEASLGSKATQINFFIHNLAQMKFGSVANLTDGVLSFCPTSYSSSKEERILSAQVTKCLKRYYPQRYYVYLIEVTRPHNKELVFRRYSEFHEMHTKMVANFPDHTFPALPGKIYVGRSQVRHVSEKRRIQLNEYLQSLLKMDSIVAESDILCTFLHRMIRDEVDSSKMDEDMSDSSYSGSVSLSAVNYPKVKLCISYDSSDQELVVMVRHARNLVPVHGTNTANPYVKVYLLPDPYKTTKKKTKVAKKTLHPTYNETLKYYIPQAELLSRTLYLCVWDQAVLPKQCLGAITIDVASLTDLTSGIEDWYNLEKPHNSSLSYAPL